MAQTNLSKKQKQTHGHREQTVVAKGEGGASGRDWEFGVPRCKLLHLEWIIKEVLSYSTGSSIQSLGTEYDGREYEKKNVCNWVTLLYSRNWQNIVNQL